MLGTAPPGVNAGGGPTSHESGGVPGPWGIGSGLRGAQGLQGVRHLGGVLTLHAFPTVTLIIAIFLMLQMSGHQIQLSLVTGLAVIANLVANVIVAPEYGAIGVAWVTAITISLRMMVHIVLARHYTGALSLPDPRVLSPGNLKRLMKRT